MSITWRTYTVDGRSLVVDRTSGGEWQARCDDGPERRSADLAEAILAASGMGELEPLRGDAMNAWTSWAREHAAKIAAEAEQSR
jgi:hypothetical protein